MHVKYVNLNHEINSKYYISRPTLTFKNMVHQFLLHYENGLIKPLCFFNNSTILHKLFMD